jgi:hypothetical protein
MTKYKISFHSPDKDIKGEKKKLDIYQNESNENIKLSPSLEIRVKLKDINQKPKAKDIDKPKNKIMAPKKNINDQPKNKIELPKFKPNYTSKNRIEPKRLKPDYKSVNKIKSPELKPNYNPINKIEPPKLPLNYSPKNKIYRTLKKLDLNKNQLQKRFIELDKPSQIKDNKLNPIILVINKNKKFTMNEVYFLKKNNIKIDDLKTRYDWIKNKSIASRFYREVIYSQFKRIPTTREIHKMGYTGFMAAVKRNLKIGMTDLVKEAGFTPSFEFKYEYKNKSICDLQEFFLNTIYPSFKIKNNLEENKPPTSEQINLSEYRGLLNALKNKDYSYNEFIISMGFKPNYEILYHDKSYSEIKNLFRKEIIPDLKEKFELDNNESPSYNEIEKYYRGLLKTLNRFDKTYLDLIKDLDLTPRQLFEKTLGETNHEALRLLLSKFMNHDRTVPNYYSETKILYSSRNLKIDGLIINNPKFSKNVISRLKTLTDIDINHETQINNLIRNIKYKDFLLFDFSNGYFYKNNTKLRTELIARKILKYHELDKSLLFLVGTRWPYNESMRNLPFALGYKNKSISTKNTLLISPFFFGKIIGINGENLRIFNSIISLNEKGNLNGINDLLEDFNKSHIKILNTDHFKKFLENSSLNKWI